jgi:ribosome-associated protein
MTRFVEFVAERLLSGQASVSDGVVTRAVLRIGSLGNQKDTPLPALKSPRPAKSATSTPAASAPAPAVPTSDAKVTATRDTSLKLAELLVIQLEDDKAEDILSIDLTGKSPMADVMIVASGRSQRHVGALSDHVARKLKESGAEKVRVEGMPNADWVLIDAGDVIVHIFRPEVREFYNLERIWGGETPTSRRTAPPPPFADDDDVFDDDSIDDSLIDPATLDNDD